MGHHYGHPYMNVTTIAGAYRMIVKKVAEMKNREIIEILFVCKRYIKTFTEAS